GFGLRGLVHRLGGGRGLAGLGDARLFAGLGAGRNPGARGLGDPRLDLRGAIQVLRGPEARAGDVDLRHQAAPCYAKGANAAEERLLGGDAARSRRGLRGEQAGPLTGDEALVRVSDAEATRESIAFEAGAEPDAAGAEAHEGHVVAVVRARDAGAAGARQEHPTLRRRERRVTVGLLHELRRIGAVSAQPPER